MPLLPYQTNSKPAAPLYAPAGAGGGGGSIALSTIVMAGTLGGNQTLVIDNPLTPGYQDYVFTGIAGNFNAISINDGAYNPSVTSLGLVCFAGVASNVSSLSQSSLTQIASYDTSKIGGYTNLQFLNSGTYMSSLYVSSINGGVAAFTSFGQQDVGSLFSTLFAANPSLSTISF